MVRAIDLHVHLPTTEWLEQSLGPHLVPTERYFRAKVDRRTIEQVAQDYASRDLLGVVLDWDDESVTGRGWMGNDWLAGLSGLIGLLIALFVGGSLLQGLAFYAMNWSGQRALRRIREDLFAQIHRLSLGYYARNEAGNIMSRITSDTDTIQQALGFALLNVISGALVIVLIVAAMLRSNVPYALLSLSVVPIMALATFYFSGQARKAFRASRQQMGSVNAGLQESIAGAREVQAFNREGESIEQFRRTNAANRDANVRARDAQLGDLDRPARLGLRLRPQHARRLQLAIGIAAQVDVDVLGVEVRDARLLREQG